MNATRTILFASTNRGKLVEVRGIATENGVEILSPEDLADELGIGVPQVEENGTNYLENAKKKAEEFFAWSNVSSLADDTGLEVKSLGGRPGVSTARFAGPNATPEENMRKLLKELSGVEDRSARFVCCLYLISKDGSVSTVESYLEGEIAQSPSGDGGFGYDPVFVVNGYGKTLSQLKQEGVDVETHRTKALREILKK